jgi:hypothetical protein
MSIVFSYNPVLKRAGHADAEACHDNISSSLGAEAVHSAEADDLFPEARQANRYIPLRSA